MSVRAEKAEELRRCSELENAQDREVMTVVLFFRFFPFSSCKGQFWNVCFPFTVPVIIGRKCGVCSNGTGDPSNFNFIGAAVFCVTAQRFFGRK